MDFEPYYETTLGKYFVGDNKDILSNFSDETFDAVITDPPFFERDKYNMGTYDAYVNVLPELVRVMKENSWLIVYFPSTRLPETLEDTTKYFKYVDRFIVEFRSTMVKGAFGDKKTLEVLVFKKGRPKVRERFYNDIIPGLEDPTIVTLHPRSSMWKPTLATATFITKIIGLDKTILDPFAGLGSILIVAERLGLKWVGIDKNRDYAEISRKIIKEGIEPKMALKESRN